MKTFKVFSIFVILFFSVVNIGFAQSKITEEQKKEMKAVAEPYIAKLNLSAEQQEKFASISTKYAEKMLALKESEGAKVTKIKEAKTIQADKDAEIKAMLTAEQYATYTSFAEELRAKQKAILEQ